MSIIFSLHLSFSGNTKSHDYEKVVRARADLGDGPGRPVAHPLLRTFFQIPPPSPPVFNISGDSYLWFVPHLSNVDPQSCE